MHKISVKSSNVDGTFVIQPDIIVWHHDWYEIISCWTKTACLDVLDFIELAGFPVVSGVGPQG